MLNSKLSMKIKEKMKRLERVHRKSLLFAVHRKWISGLILSIEVRMQVSYMLNLIGLLIRLDLQKMNIRVFWNRLKPN